MSDKNRELVLEGDRVVSVKDAPKRWVAKVEPRRRFDPSTGERLSDLIMGHVVEDGDEIALIHGLNESIAVRTNLMAAAPDLLAACQRALSELESGVTMGCEEDLREAVAKAEGRSE